MNKLYKIIWDTSEFTGIRLGRFAPFVFGKMIGVKGVLQKEPKGWEEALQEARDRGDLITLEEFKETLK